MFYPTNNRIHSVSLKIVYILARYSGIVKRNGKFIDKQKEANLAVFLKRRKIGLAKFPGS